MKGLLAIALFFVGASASPELVYKGQCSKKSGKASASDAAYNLKVSTSEGYSCETTYDTSVGHATDDCFGWFGDKSMSIELLATDASGRVATCMNWELVHGSAAAGDSGLLSPMTPEYMKMMSEQSEKLLTALVPKQLTAMVPKSEKNNTEENRLAATGHYLDAMTQASHKCVPLGQPEYGVFLSGFPSHAGSELEMRLSHALLASSGTIWSIDRSCNEAFSVEFPSGVYDSCVPPFENIPHCHIDCQMTWNMGPNGAAQPWGVSILTHQIPSPAFSIIEHHSRDIKGQPFGNIGCAGF